jgi:hypothetical protein
MKIFNRIGLLIAAMMLASVAQAASLSDYFENRLVDWAVRGQSYTPPGTLYVGLATASGNDAACGTEVSRSGTAYDRATITPSLANMAGTQSTGSTTASTGTGGTTSNNGTVTFPTPSGGNWGTVVEFCVFDAGFTTLNGAIASAGATSMTVTSASQFPGSGNYDVLIDSEIVTITAGQGTTTWTITRGVRGTTATTHSNGAGVSGMMLWRAALTVNKTINNGDAAPSFAAGALTFQIDN